jgi:hypothetical protein
MLFFPVRSAEILTQFGSYSRLALEIHSFSWVHKLISSTCKAKMVLRNTNIYSCKIITRKKLLDFFLGSKFSFVHITDTRYNLGYCKRDNDDVYILGPIVQLFPLSITYVPEIKT